MREIKDYLIYEGEQYRSPEKAGDAKDRMLSLRKKGQVARKTFTQIAKLFQEMHSDWNLHPTSQWMNQAQRGLFTGRWISFRANAGSPFIRKCE